MILARCVVGISRTMHSFILFVLFPGLFAFADRWDSQGAAQAFQEARQKRTEIAQSNKPSPDQYLECARAYRKVYVKDPHYGRAGDAIYEEGLVYQEAGDRFSKLEYYRMAANRFQLLIKDYGGNQSCPDALKRLGTIYSTHLNNPTAAEEAYRALKTRYRYSPAAIERIRAEAVSPADRPVAAPVLPVDHQPVSSSAKEPQEPQSGSLSTVRSIRFWSTADYTRVIIDMDAEAKYEQSRLSNPDRVYFDILNSKLGDELLTHAIAVGDDILKEVRVAQHRSGTVRVVFDISDIGGVSVSNLHDPFRIVVDLSRKGVAAASLRRPDPVPVSRKPRIETKPQPPPPMAITEMQPSPPKEAPAKTAKIEQPPVPDNPEPKMQKPLSITELPATPAREVKPAKAPAADIAPASMANTAAVSKGEGKLADTGIKAPPAVKPEILPPPKAAEPTSRGDRTLTRMLGLKVGRIVIDPGHGGHDFGTIGPGGLPEKDLVLSLARSLRKMIQEKIGAEVILTRDDDTFISLEERTAIANQHKADLFISIHANSSRNHSISGVETYYLDFAKTDAEREIAARENATTVNNVRDLEDLIKKIAQADKSTESRELASIVQTKLYSGARQVFSSTRNRGVRSAPFIVLIGANMPSVLAEVAFISNPKDERLLNREAAKQCLVKALFTGIDGYMKTLGSDVVQIQSSSQGK